MELWGSSALFPDTTLRAELKRDYDDQWSRMCYGAYPSFEQVLDALEGIRPHLIGIPDD